MMYLPDKPTCKKGCIFPNLHCTTRLCKHIDPISCGYYSQLGPVEKAQLEELFRRRASLFSNTELSVEIALNP